MKFVSKYCTRCK